MKAAWNAEVGQQFRRELMSVAADLKAEVKLETAALREQLVRAVGQVSAEVKAESQQLQEGLARIQKTTAEAAREADAASIRARASVELSDSARSGALQAAVEGLRSAPSSPSPRGPRDPEADVAPVMDELRQIRSRTDFDFSSLLDAIGKAEREIEELKRQKAQPEPRQQRHSDASGAGGEAEFLLAVQEVKELRRAFPQVQVDLAGVLSVVRSIKADVDQSPVLRELAQLRHQGVQADLSPLLEEIRELRLEGPQAWVGKVDLSPMQQEIRGLRELNLRAQADLSSAVGALSELRKQVDLLPSEKDIRQLRTQFEVDFLSLNKAVRERQTELSLEQAARDQRPAAPEPPPATGVEVRQVLEEVRRLRADVAFPTIPKVDLSPVLQELREIRQRQPQADLAPLLDELRGLWRQIPQGEAALAELLKGLGEGLTELREQRLRSDAELNPLLAAVREGMAKAHHEMQALGQLGSQVQAGAEALQAANDRSAEVMQALQDTRSQLDPSVLLQELRELKQQQLLSQDDVSSILVTLRKSDAEAACSPVILELRKFQQGLAELRQQSARKEQHDELLPLVAAVRDGVAELGRELRQLGPQARADHIELLRAVREGRLQLDPALLLHDVKELKQHQASAREDLSAALVAMKEARAEVEKLALRSLEELRSHAAPPGQQGLAQEIRELRHQWLQQDGERSAALALLRKMRDQAESDSAKFVQGMQSLGKLQVEVDLSPILAAVERVGVKEELAAIVQEVRLARHRPQQAELDLSPVLSALLEIRKQVALLPSDKELGQLRKLLEVDFSSLSQDINSLRTAADTTEILKAVREGRTAWDLSPILQAIRESRQTVDLAPVLEAVHKSRAEVDLSPLLHEIRDLKHQRPQADLSPLLLELKGLWQQIPKGEAELSAMLSGLGEGLAELRRELREPRPPLDAPALLQELREMKHQRQQVDADVISTLSAVRDNVSDVWRVLREVQQLGASAKADRAETLKAVREIRPAVDYPALLKEVTELKQHQLLLRGDMSLIPGLIKESRSEATPRRPSVSPRDSELQLALGPVRDGLAALQREVHGLQQLGPQVEGRLQDLMQAVSQPRSDASILPILNHVRDAVADVWHELQSFGPKAKSEIAELLQAIKDSSLQPAVSSVRDMVAEMRRELQGIGPRAMAELSEIARTLRDARPDSNLQPMLSGVREMVDEVRQELQKLGPQAKVELEELVRVIRESRPDSNLMSALSTLRDGVANARKDIQQLSLPGKAELVELLQIIREIRPQFEAKEVLAELQDVKQHQILAREGISVLRSEWRQATAGLDFPTVVKAIEESRTVDISPLLFAINGIKAEMDFSKVLASIEESKTSLLSTFRQLQPQAEVNLSAILNAVKAIQLDVDLGPVLSELRKIPPHVDAGLATVLKATKEIRTEVDFAPVLKEVRQLVSASEPDLSSVHKAFRELRADIDFSGFIKEIRQLQLRPDTDLILKAIREHRVDLDFASIMTAIRQIATPVVDLNPVVGTIRQVQSHLEAAIHANKVELAPVFEQIQHVQSQVLASAARVESKVELRGDRVEGKLELQGKQLPEQLKQLPEQLKVAEFAAQLEDVSRLNKKLLALVDINHQEVLAHFQYRIVADSTVGSSKPGFFQTASTISREEVSPRKSGQWRLVKMVPKDQAPAAGVVIGSLGNTWLGPPPRDLGDPPRAPMGGAFAPDLGSVGAVIAVEAGEVHV